MYGVPTGLPPCPAAIWHSCCRGAHCAPAPSPPAAIWHSCRRGGVPPPARPATILHLCRRDTIHRVRIAAYPAVGCRPPGGGVAACPAEVLPPDGGVNRRKPQPCRRPGSICFANRSCAFDAPPERQLLRNRQALSLMPRPALHFCIDRNEAKSEQGVPPCIPARQIGADTTRKSAGTFFPSN